MKRFLLISILLLLHNSFVFCQAIIQGSFIHGGINRTYRLYVPAIYNSNFAVPLVLNLHGYGSTAIEQEFYSNFKSIADTANFLIVHPDGTVDGTGNQFWNAFAISNVDDVDFLSALIDTISNNYNIDQNCIYSTGMSNGGFMSHKLACDLGSKITAIASVTGTMTWSEYNNCVPIHPTPVMQIHGTADPIVPYNGSVALVPVDSIVSFWVQGNNCLVNPVFTVVPDINQNDGCTAEHYLYTNGDNGSSVEFYKIIGGGHTWPGSPFIIGVTNQDFSASIEIWKFFRKYKLNTLTSLHENTLNKDFPLKIFPNPSSGRFSIIFNNRAIRKISVTDLYGRINKFDYCDCDEYKLLVKEKGIYFITIEENSNSSNYKIIVY